MCTDLRTRSLSKPLVLAFAILLFSPWPTSRDAALATPPSITSQPRGGDACDGVKHALLLCGASGTQPLTYQWRRGTNNLVNGGNIAGATSNTLYLWPPRPSDAAPDYNCEVTNAEGSALSNNAALTVWPTGTADVNGDGAVNGLDVQAFLNIWLSRGYGSASSFCAADMDGNGALGCEDLCVFVQVLLQSPPVCGLAPENDNCPNAILISIGALYTGSTAYATRDGPHLNCEQSCGPGCNTSPDVWYKWVADFTGPADFSTCSYPFVSDYDTMLALYDGCPSLGGVALTCNDDICGTFAVICSFPVNAGRTYWICVSGWGGDKGCFSLRVGPPTGDCN